MLKHMATSATKTHHLFIQTLATAIYSKLLLQVDFVNIEENIATYFDFNVNFILRSEKVRECQ
ncbi:CLUMA_CG002338, isoform A [Clunio marinus]|uniref:CLUMA_CG002338, isoform A n=1 Tax=Clunio marinus TaxID=568069 RepID=A0A1J1HK41_9DIPT|nr:CLUMA_CG002338, isoform A [Clunio marinus]